jgi:hypothetical protein
VKFFKQTHGTKIKLDLREVVLLDSQSTMDLICNPALVKKTFKSSTNVWKIFCRLVIWASKQGPRRFLVSAYFFIFFPPLKTQISECRFKCTKAQSSFPSPLQQLPASAYSNRTPFLCNCHFLSRPPMLIIAHTLTESTHSNYSKWLGTFKLWLLLLQ